MALKAFIKPFEAPQNSVKIKIYNLIFISMQISEMHGTLRVKLISYENNTYTPEKIIAKYISFKFYTAKAPKSISLFCCFRYRIWINDKTVVNEFNLLEIIGSPNKNGEICGTGVRL